MAVIGPLLAALLTPYTGAGETGSDSDVTELVQRAFDSLYPVGQLQTVELKSGRTDVSSMSQTISIRLLRGGQGERGDSLVRFASPPSMRGASVLVLDTQNSSRMYVHLPAFSITRRVSTSQIGDSFFGTELSYEDLEPKSVSSFRIEADRTIGTGDCIAVRIVPIEELRTSYEFTNGCIDPELGVFRWIEFFGAGGVLVKRLTSDTSRVEHLEESIIIRSFRMSNARGTRYTDFKVLKVEVPNEIPRAIFTVSNLERGNIESDRRRLLPGN